MSVQLLRTFDFVVERGDSMTIELGPVTIDDVAQDLTAGGTKLWLTVKNSPDDVDPGLVQLTEISGITPDLPTTPAKNMATAFIPSVSFADPTLYAKRKDLVWDAVWELGLRHERIARGKITVVPSVTRAT